MNQPNFDRHNLENFIIKETRTQPEDGNHYQIYRCQHKKLNSLSLLKCIPASTIQRIGDIASPEQAALQKINSPNVIKIQAYFQSNQMHCLLFEDCDSSMNQIFIQNNFRLPEQVAIRYMLEIVQGVQAIHQAQIIHRDLQLRNIFVHENQPKIANFGFSVINQINQSRIIPQLGISAPEQFTASYKPSFSEDIFSLGSIFFTLLTGSLPFDCSSAENYYTSVQHKILNIDPQIILATKEKIINLIRAMMNFNQNERPTLNAIKNVLCQAVNHEQLQVKKINPFSLMMIQTIDWTNEKIQQLVNQILYLNRTADEFGGKEFYNILKIMFPRLMLLKRCYFELDELIKVVKSKNETNLFTSEIRNLEFNLQTVKQKLETQINLCRDDRRLKYDDIQGWQNELNFTQNDNFYDVYEKAMAFLIAHMKRTEIPYLQKQNQKEKLQHMLVLFIHIQLCSANFDENSVKQDFEGAYIRTIDQLISQIQ